MGLSWLDIGIATGFYVVTTLGVTVGYHRYFTHGAFTATRPLRIALAVAGGLAAQGTVPSCTGRSHGWAAGESSAHCVGDWTTRSGHVAWWISAWLVDPVSMPENPPRPRLPITSS